MKASAIPILLLVFVLVGGCCSYTSSADLTRAVTATIEVERPENNGSVNILPCIIAFSDGQKFKLSGGDRVAVSVRSGKLWVAAFSPGPYKPNSDNLMARRSSCYRLQARPGETLRLSVEPKSKGSTYIGGWTIELAADHRSALDAGTPPPSHSGRHLSCTNEAER